MTSFLVQPHYMPQPQSRRASKIKLVEDPTPHAKVPGGGWIPMYPILTPTCLHSFTVFFLTHYPAPACTRLQTASARCLLSFSELFHGSVWLCLYTIPSCLCAQHTQIFLKSHYTLHSIVVHLHNISCRASTQYKLSVHRIPKALYRLGDY